MLVDSHCHLDFPDFAEDRAAVIARAQAAGVGLMVTISTKVSEADTIIGLAEAHDALVCSVGIHPHEAGREAPVTAERLVELASHPKVVGIGETGLDYFYEKSPRDAQQRNFRAHIEAARMSGLPLIVHARDADEDTADILEDEMEQGLIPGSSIVSRQGRSLPVVPSTSAFTFPSPASPRSKTPAICATPSRACLWTGCWSRLTRRFWRRCPIAANAMSRASSPIRQTCWPN